jgi:hypothetical protein
MRSKPLPSSTGPLMTGPFNPFDVPSVQSIIATKPQSMGNADCVTPLKAVGYVLQDGRRVMCVNNEHA